MLERFCVEMFDVRPVSGNMFDSRLIFDAPLEFPLESTSQFIIRPFKYKNRIRPMICSAFSDDCLFVHWGSIFALWGRVGFGQPVRK